MACLLFATAAFQSFVVLGRLVRSVLPKGNGRLMQSVVAYGLYRADEDAEKLEMTDQLFDAAACELAVLSRDQPCLIAGDINVEPTMIPCLSKGILAGLWIDLESSWARATGAEAAVTCKRDSGLGWEVPGEISSLVALRRLLPWVGVGSTVVAGYGLILLSVPLLCLPSGLLGCVILSRLLLFGLPLVCLRWISLRVPNLLRSGTFGRFMMIGFSSFLWQMRWLLVMLWEPILPCF